MRKDLIAFFVKSILCATDIYPICSSEPSGHCQVVLTSSIIVIVLLVAGHPRIITPCKIGLLRKFAFRIGGSRARNIQPTCQTRRPSLRNIFYFLFVAIVCSKFARTRAFPCIIFPCVLATLCLITSVIVTCNRPGIFQPDFARAIPLVNDFVGCLSGGIERVFLFLCAGKHAGFGSILLVKDLIACGIVICHNTR